MGALGQQARLRADTVIMNPPFGTRRKGADLDFLRAAFQVHSRVRVVPLYIPCYCVLNIMMLQIEKPAKLYLTSV